jgi:hypothetical protein
MINNYKPKKDVSSEKKAKNSYEELPDEICGLNPKSRKSDRNTKSTNQSEKII